VGLNFTPLDPVKALYWSAVLNGVVAVPVMAVMMRLSMRPAIMGDFTLPPILQILGSIGTLVMGATVLAMVATWVA
jgi:Mn2+/Fe2+ NRAMP family transporter